jgi:integrase
MASTHRRSNGRYEVQFTDHRGQRHTAYLGAVSKSFADDFGRCVDLRVAERRLGHRPSKRIAAWLEDLSPRRLKWLANRDLIELRAKEATLRELVDAHKESLAVSDSTYRNIKQATDALLAHFGERMFISRITEADARRFRSWLVKHGGKDETRLAQSTVSRRTRRAREVFKFAVDSKWIDTNPFAALARWSEVNRERDYFVARETMGLVLGQITDLEFKAIVVLARYAGLRCPSEITRLVWRDVNWGRGTLRVTSPKTRRHPGGELRLVPLFPEVRKALSDLWARDPEGPDLLFPRYQVTGVALRKRLRRHCTDAGVVPWPRTWKNLRASCEIELVRKYDLPSVAAWLGHSIATMTQHYLQIVKDQRAEAVGSADENTSLNTALLGLSDDVGESDHTKKR